MKLENILNKIEDSWENTNKTFVPLGISFLFGVGIGAIGKTTNMPGLPTVPIIMDILVGKISPQILPYSLGVAMNYIPEIYLASKFSEIFYK